MEIRKVSTLAFAVSEEKEKELEKKLSAGAGKILGLVPSEKTEIRKGYFPVLGFKLTRPEMVHKGITSQTEYERRENTFFVNLASGVLYHAKNGKIESYELVNKAVNLSEDSVRSLGDIIRKGESMRDEYNPVVIMELANACLIRIYKPALKELYTLVMDEVVAEADERNKIKHTIVKERVNLNFHMPKFGDPGYDLPSVLATTNTMVEEYSKDPIKYSVDQTADLLRELYQADVKILGVTFMPYLAGSYLKKGGKEQRVAQILFPVCFKGEKDTIKTGVEIKPVALSTEVGALKSVPIERETIDFSEVAGLEDIKKEIREEIIYPLIRPDLAKEYGRKGGGSILLYGPPGCGKTHIAKATIGECGAGFYNINISDVVKKGFQEGAKALHEIFENASKNPPAIIFFDEFDALGGKRDPKHDQSEKMIVNQLLTEMDGVESMKENILFIAATNAPWAVDPALRRAERFTKQVFIPPPDAKVREELFRIHTKKEPLEADVDLKKLAEITDGYASADIKAICDAAAKIPWEEALESGVERKIRMSDFLQAVSKQKSSLLPWYREAYKRLEDSGEADLYKEYAKHILKYAGGVDLIKKPHLSFKDVGDLEEVKEEIRKSVIYPMVREDLAKEFGKTVGGGILLYGPPGCGKTYIAKATAGECNASFFNVKITDILCAEKGESEKKLHEIFERASRNTPAILFFDEIEGIAGRRDMMGISEAQLVDEFLTEMDGFKKTKGLVVIGATNSPWATDPALRRSERFTKQIFIHPPDYDARVDIFRIHCKEKPLAPDIDFERLADMTAGCTSSDIKAICDKACEIPWEEALKGAPERKVGNDDFLKIIKDTKSSLIPWINMAKRELEKSGEKGMYKELEKLLSEFEAYGKEDFKEIIEQEKKDLLAKQKEELSCLQEKRGDLENKIKMAQHKYYNREIATESFKNIIEDYEKQVIDIDLRIRKAKEQLKTAEGEGPN